MVWRPRKHLDRLAVRVDRLERRRTGIEHFGLDPGSVARMSLVLAGPGGVSAEHRELLRTDPETRPKPAAVAGLLTMVLGRPYSTGLRRAGAAAFVRRSRQRRRAPSGGRPPTTRCLNGHARRRAGRSWRCGAAPGDHRGPCIEA